MKIRCDGCGDVVFDEPLSLKGKGEDPVDVADGDALLFTRHNGKQFEWEIRHSTNGAVLGGGMHECDEL
jgi:hypothetical protein